MKTGVAIIACDRTVYTEQCVQHLLQNNKDVQETIVINDGQPIPNLTVEEVKTPEPYSTVGVAKNLGMKTLLDRGCTEIFLIENDILVKDSNVFNSYIEHGHQSGLLHLNFGYHGPANRTPDYTKAHPRIIIEYSPNIKIALNTHSVGAFSYFNKKFIDVVGYHDTYFKNAWEHVELCQRGIKKGLLPGFWWFPDVAGSENMLEEIPGSIEKSSITHTEKWIYNMRRGAEYYKKLYGYIPTETPSPGAHYISGELKCIYKKYSIK